MEIQEMARKKEKTAPSTNGREDRSGYSELEDMLGGREQSLLVTEYRRCCEKETGRPK